MIGSSAAETDKVLATGGSEIVADIYSALFMRCHYKTEDEMLYPVRLSWARAVQSSFVDLLL
jgi:hypothetical protein